MTSWLVQQTGELERVKVRWEFLQERSVARDNGRVTVGVEETGPDGASAKPLVRRIWTD